MNEDVITRRDVPAEPSVSPWSGQRKLTIVALAPRDLLRLVPWAPALSAAAFIVVLLSNLRPILEGIYWNSDYAFPTVLTEDFLRNPPGGLIKVGVAAHFSTLGFLFVTKGLPFHRDLWLISPLLLTFATAGIIGWACWKVAGRWAGIVSFSLTLAASPPVLETALGQGMRSHTWLGNSLLGAACVLAPRWADSGRLPAVAGLGLFIGLTGGITLASDPLFLVSGLGPFLGAALLALLLHRTKTTARVALLAGGSSALAFAVSFLVSNLMHAAGFRKTYMNTGFMFATPEQMLSNVASFAGQVLLLGNAHFFGKPLGVESLAALLLAFALVAGALAPIVLVARQISKRRALEPVPPPPVVLLVGFWGLSVIAVALGAILTTVTALGTTRYVVPIFFAIAATVPVWCGQVPWKRMVCGVTGAIFILLSISGAVRLADYPKRPLIREKAQIVSFLEKEGVRKGYSTYWNSHALTYHSDMKIEARPIEHCPGARAAEICPFFVNVRSIWYEPHSKRRTFLIVDPTVARSLGPASAEQFGPPSKERRLGEISVFIYDYDIASRFGRAG